MTSIEWLKQEYKVSGILTDLDFEQAKEMHKQEQETLYTDEQVREAMVKARLYKSSENADIIIQSLKQPKKD